MARYGKERVFTQGMRVRSKGRKGWGEGTVEEIRPDTPSGTLYGVRWDTTQNGSLLLYHGDALMPVAPPADYREEHERICSWCRGGVTHIFLRPPLDDAERAARAAKLAAPMICPNCHFVAGVQAGAYRI